MAADDHTAKDLLRSGELPEVEVCGWQLSSRLVLRRYRRPAGSSERLWAKVGVEDPFAQKKQKAELSLEEHRAPAAAQRFKQIDKHAKKKERSKLPAAARKPQHSPEFKARLAKAEKLARDKEKRKRLVARYGEAAADKLLGVPSASPSAPAPTSATKKKRSQPTPSPRPASAAEAGAQSDGEPLDRRPPRVAHPQRDRRGKQRVRVTSRRDEDGVDRRPPRVGMAADKPDPTTPRRSATDDGVDRRPPRVSRRSSESEPRARRRPTVTTGADAIDRRPPRVGLAAEQDAAAEAIDRTPPRVGPAAEIDRTPPKPGDGGASTGMDDLFGGMQQGRVRRPKEEGSGRKKVLVTENPAGDIDRRPPRLDRPPAPESDADAEPAVDRTPPRLDRTPPKPGSAGASTGMDDLFGGMQQGRVKRPTEDKTRRKKVLVTENPEGDVDRSPPRLDRTPAEETPEPVVDRSPPPIDRTPPKPGGGGASSGMDLFAGMDQGRVRRPKKEKTGRKKVLVTENPEGDIDRSPPRLDRPPEADGDTAPEPKVDRTPPTLDRTPPKPGSGGASSGMDLFAGMEQGRVRRPKKEKTGRKKVLVTENPDGEVDRRPPRLDRPPVPKPAAEAAPKAAPPPTPEAEAAPAVDRRPPRIDRTPPKPGGGGASSGMDDLFGGMQQGRVRRPKDEGKRTSNKVLVTENPDGDVDRTPPRIVDKD